MIPILLSIIFSLLTLTSCSQEYSVRKLIEINPHFQDSEYTFPILEGPDKAVTNRINSFLVIDQLNMELGREETSIFEQVWQKPDDPFARINDLTFNVNLLNHELYAVTISGEFCGAYCEGYDMTYTFDLASGDILTLDTLFSENGKVKLLKELMEHKSRLIEKKVRELKEIAESDTIDAVNLAYHQEMLDLYQNCISEYTDLKSIRYIPSKDSLEIFYERCSAHYNRNLDELWYFKKEISISDWTEQLSGLGRKKLKN